MLKNHRALKSLIAALAVHALALLVMWRVGAQAPEANDWRDKTARMEFTLTEVAAVAEPPPAPDAVTPQAQPPAASPAQSAGPPPRTARSRTDDAPAPRVSTAPSARTDDAPVPRTDAAGTLVVRDAPRSQTPQGDAPRDDATRAPPHERSDIPTPRATTDAERAAADAERVAADAERVAADAERVAADAERVAAVAAQEAADRAHAEADSRAVFAPSPKKRDRSLIARVLRGSSAVPMPDRFVEDGKAPDHPLLSDQERAEAGARQWASVAPESFHSREKKLVPGKEGGYRYVDADTGEPIPDDAPPPVGDTLGPKMVDNQRAGGWGYRDAPWGTRPFKEKPHDDLQPTPDGGYAFEASGFSAKIERDGSVRFDENLASIKPGKTAPIYAESGMPMGEYAADYTKFSFDATDMLMRLAGKDPYVSAKLRFLDDTRTLREDMRATHRIAGVERALVGLRRDLDATWHNVRRTGPQRRRVIFEMWDDCAEGPEGDIARDFIVTFVQAHLPADSDNAFTLAELKMFNAERVSRREFSPYA